MLLCANADFKQPIDKVVWILIVILLGPLGTFLFLGSGRKQTTVGKKSEQWVV